MKNVLVSAVVALGLLIFTPTSNAAVFDFQAWVTANGEQGFDNLSPFTLTDSGLTLTATAFEQPGMLDSHVYMDDVFNGIVGGMGVCTVLSSGNQCNPSSDDNVSLEGGSGEMLSWGFSQSIAEITLELGNDSHFDFLGIFEYNIGSGWLSVTADANGMATLLLGGSGQIDFRAAGNTISDHFYIRNASTTVVPVPAAVWLFGSGLIGLAGLARRKT